MLIAHNSRFRRMRTFPILVGIALAATMLAAASGRATSTPASAAAAQYSHAVTRICAGALLFDHAHPMGTRSDALSVARDIRTSTARRLARVTAVSVPAELQHLSSRWISSQRQLAAMFAKRLQMTPLGIATTTDAAAFGVPHPPLIPLTTTSLTRSCPCGRVGVRVPARRGTNRSAPGVRHPPASGDVRGCRQIERQPALCRSLNELADGPAPSATPVSFAEPQALLVLTHEAVHLSRYPGRRPEALSECRALQLVHDTALTISVDDTTARTLGHEALPYDAQLPGPGDWRVGLGEIPNYHAPGCHPGGKLDIYPDSHDWPN